MEQAGIDAVLMVGYNDPGRLRILRYCSRQRIPSLLFGDSNIAGERVRGAKAWIKKVLLRRVVRGCAAVMPCGSMGRQYFLKYGARPDRIFNCPYEPDYGLIERVTPEQVQEAAGRFGLAPGRRRVVFSGRLTWVKRPDLVIDAFVKVAERRPDWDLLILGDGDLRS